MSSPSNGDLAPSSSKEAFPPNWAARPRFPSRRMVYVANLQFRWKASWPTFIENPARTWPRTRGKPEIAGLHNVGLCGPFFGMRLGQQILRLFWFLVVGFVAGVGMSARAQAQDYPTHSITVVVGFPPGGPTDTVARIVADQMSKSLAQSVIVENIPGAAGTIGGAVSLAQNPMGTHSALGNGRPM